MRFFDIFSFFLYFLVIFLLSFKNIIFFFFMILFLYRSLNSWVYNRCKRFLINSSFSWRRWVFNDIATFPMPGSLKLLTFSCLIVQIVFIRFIMDSGWNRNCHINSTFCVFIINMNFIFWVFGVRSLMWSFEKFLRIRVVYVSFDLVNDVGNIMNLLSGSEKGGLVFSIFLIGFISMLHLYNKFY